MPCLPPSLLTVALVLAVSLSGVAPPGAEAAVACKEAMIKCISAPPCEDKFNKAAQVCDSYAEQKCPKKSLPECKKAAAEFKAVPEAADLQSCSCADAKGKKMCAITKLAAKVTASCA